MWSGWSRREVVTVNVTVVMSFENPRAAQTPELSLPSSLGPHSSPHADAHS